MLQRLARGAGNREIGRALFVSDATVKTHLIHSFRKLGVKDRTAAVTRAVQRGLLELAGEQETGNRGRCDGDPHG